MQAMETERHSCSQSTYGSYLASVHELLSANSHKPKDLIRKQLKKDIDCRNMYTSCLNSKYSSKYYDQILVTLKRNRENDQVSDYVNWRWVGQNIFFWKRKTASLLFKSKPWISIFYFWIIMKCHMTKLQWPNSTHDSITFIKVRPPQCG
jgi:hypothetical protein